MRRRDYVRVTGVQVDSPPVITLLGGNITIEEGVAYIEPGYSAYDDVDGDLTGNVIINYNGLNVNDPVEGVYTITYNVSDSLGNTDQKSRVVTVEEVVEFYVPAPPIISNVLTTTDPSQYRISITNQWDGGQPIIGYKVEYRAGGDWITTIENNESGEFHTVTTTSGLPISGNVEFRIYAINSIGTSAASNIFVYENIETIPPTAPGGVIITNNLVDPTKVSWNASTDNVGIAGYDVYCRVDGNPNWFKWNSSIITDLFYFFEANFPTGPYWTKIQAVDVNGNTADSQHNFFAINRTISNHNRLTNHDFIVSTGDQAGRRVGLEIYWCGNANAPLVVWCPGSGEYCRVPDASPINYIGLVAGEGLARYVRNGNEKPYNIISIQMPQYQSNWDHHVVNEALTQAKTLFPEFDINNVSGGGWSAGTGFAEWSVQYPHRTRVVFPMASWGFPSTQATVNTWLAAGVAVWAFHADPDGTITFNGNLKNYMVNSPSYNQDKHRFTRFTSGGHNIPDEIITGIGLASDSTNNYTPYPYSGNYSTLDDFILQWG